MKINAAVIQDSPVFLNIEASTEKADKLIREAAESGAGIVAFPETWLPGYPVWLDNAPKAAFWDYPPAKKLFRLLFENSIEVNDKYFKKLMETAKDTNTYIVMGAHEKEGATIYNAIIYFSPEGEYKVHRKLVPTYTERLVWGRGDGSMLHTVDTPAGQLGALVCWEHWMPLARAAMHSKNEAVHVAQWPTVSDMHLVASRHYAFEGNCFVLAAGSILSQQDMIDGINSLGDGLDDARELLESTGFEAEHQLIRGGSAIIAPDGSYLAGPVYDKNDIIIAELDTDLIDEARLTLDTDGHYSRPDIFTLKVDTSRHDNVRFE